MRPCRLCGWDLDKHEPDNTSDLCGQCQLGEDMSEEWELDGGRVIGWGLPGPPGSRRRPQ